MYYARFWLDVPGEAKRVYKSIRICPVDGRGAMAHLTRQGAARLAEAAPTHVAGVRRYLIDTFQGDLGGLSDGLKRIEAELGYSEADLPVSDCGQPKDRAGR